MPLIDPRNLQAGVGHTPAPLSASSSSVLLVLLNPITRSALRLGDSVVKTPPWLVGLASAAMIGALLAWTWRTQGLI
ncbi:MAG TPA: hypothetical protein VEA40_15765 [Ramlibacter sp.]|nr:hypothetical protein [Ramlibacter sp.]